MSTDEIPPALLARHPELIQIGEVLASLREGRPVTTRCATCNELLKVVEPPGTGELWIGCVTGCTSFHARREPPDTSGALADP